MMVTLKRDITDNNVVVSKGTTGVIKAFQWGEKKDGYLIDFPQNSLITVNREDVTIIGERNETTRIEEKKRKSGKQEREEEM
jgi:hypothetical protein